MSGSIQEVISKGKTIQFLQFFYINYCDRTSHCAGHSKLKELDTHDFFKRKQMIKDLESELTEALKETSNTENLEVAEEANVDEAITIEAKASNNTEIDLKDE